MSNMASAMTPNPNLSNVPQQFCLRWSNHSSNLINTFNDLILNESLTDVTLGCDGVMLKAHKIVLSANSNYFRDLFIATPCKHPIVILKDIKIEDLKAIIDFMYKGEVNISSAQMEALLKTAEALRVKGLFVPSDDKNETDISHQTSMNNSDAPMVYGETPNGTLGNASGVASPTATRSGQCFNATTSGQPSSPPGICKKRKKKRNGSGVIPNSVVGNNVSETCPSVTGPTNGLRSGNRVISSVSSVSQISMPLESVTSPHIHAPSTSLVVRNDVDDDLVPASNSDGEIDTNSMDFEDDLSRIKRSSRSDRDPLVSATVAQLSNSILPSTSNNMTLVSAANTCPIVPMVSEASISDRSQSRRPNVQQQQQQQQQQLAQASQVQEQQPSQSSQPSGTASSIQRDLVSAESSMAGDTVSNDGSESWSQQGNHNMNLSMRPSDMEDSESDHTSEIKPYISFSEGSESSCRGAVDMNAMNQALALVSNDQMSIPSQSPSQETQSAGKICVCQLCHLTFTAFSSLRRHMQRHYADRERYACDVCHKSYSRKDYLKEHKKLKHQMNNN